MTLTTLFLVVASNLYGQFYTKFEVTSITHSKDMSYEVHFIISYIFTHVHIYMHKTQQWRTVLHVFPATCQFQSPLAHAPV